MRHGRNHRRWAMLRKSHLEAPQWLRHLFPEHALFDGVMNLQGEVFRDVPGRKTIRVDLDGKSCFIKQHFGVGWPEIFKNLLSLKWPILTAETEWRTIQRLDEIGCASLEVCESRDVKGLYKRARAGEIKNYTAIDSSYEPPENPELIDDTGEVSLQESVDQVMKLLDEHGIIKHGH